jgi:serine/threonine protein kinase
MQDDRIILKNYSKGSYGNIFKDNKNNVYKITKISESGMLIASNINEIIILNYMNTIKKAIKNSARNEKLESLNKGQDQEQILLDNLIKFNNINFSQVIKENIFMQTDDFDYCNYENFYLKYMTLDVATNYKYHTYMSNRFDKFLLINKMPVYQNNLENFIKKFHVYVINNFDLITKKILKSLFILHSNNLLHGDLKTANILINDVDSIILSDFGAVKMTNFNKYYLSCTISSRCPEDLEHEYNSSVPYSNSNFKSDIWSLGLIFSEMILGYNPILRMYNKLFCPKKPPETLEKEILEYYKTIDYIGISELVKSNSIKYHLNKTIYKQIEIIEKMLYINPAQRLGSIQEVYELLYGEKINLDYKLDYNYDYLKIYSESKFKTLCKIRQEHYPRLIKSMDTLKLIFVCPLVIDILDRLFIKILDFSMEKNIEFKDIEMNFLFCSVIILISGLYNQSHPIYNKIFLLFNIKYEPDNLANVNNNLLEILKLLNFDIIRPFNIYYCYYLSEQKVCTCVDKSNNENTNIYTIHNSKDKDKLISIIEHIVLNNVVGINPDYYLQKLRNL